MGRKRKQLPENSAPVDIDVPNFLGNINFENDLEELEDDIIDKQEEIETEKENNPTMQDIGWENFVMTQFEGTELDQGRPKVHGLRRVVRLLLGSIASSTAHIVQCPTMENGQRATVEYTVKVWQTKNLDRGDMPHMVEYTDVSDAWNENVNGLEFARHPSATASTRSEGRALRKLLNLSTPAAEEIATIPMDEDALNGTVSEGQVTRIDLKCEELNINVMKFINSGKNKYVDIKDVPYVKAQAMCKRLGEFHRQQRDIPEMIKGYDVDWNKKEGE